MDVRVVAAAVLVGCGGGPFTAAVSGGSAVDASDEVAAAAVDASGVAVRAVDGGDLPDGVVGEFDALESSVDSRPESGLATEADVSSGPCDGGQPVTHEVGVDGLTWQDCAPAGTYDSAQALAACEAYAAHVAPTCVSGCSLPPGTCVASSEYYPLTAACAAPVVTWTYAGQTEATGTGHVVVEPGNPATGGCPSGSDPSWD